MIEGIKIVNTPAPKENGLYFSYRYRKGSYKARKAGISPIRVMVKYPSRKFRIYGQPDEPMTREQQAFWKSKIDALKQIKRELRAVYRAKLREWRKHNPTLAKTYCPLPSELIGADLQVVALDNAN
jgi:hypothetical protein